VDNTDLGIGIQGLHPVLIVSGPSIRGGPINIAIGSSSRRPEWRDIVLDVFPSDCDPPDALEHYTRFWISGAHRIARAGLRRKLAKLGPQKLALLKVLKQSII
jgi:hypothetical protein